MLLFLAAAAIRFVLVPLATRLPGDLDSTAQYEGTANLLNPDALQVGDLANAIATGVPITIDRHVYVWSTSGDTAITHDDTTVHTPAGSIPNNHTYALNRSTLDRAPSTDRAVESHSGLTISLPLHSSPSSGYRYYDSATRTTVPMTFVDSGEVAGRTTYNYAIAAQGALQDPAIAETLPKALPKSLLRSLTPLLPEQTRVSVTAALEQLADPVSLTYDADTQATLAADTVTGTPVNGSLKQQIIANIDLNGRPVPLMPVMSIDAKLTQASVTEAAAAASSASTMLSLVEKIHSPRSARHRRSMHCAGRYPTPAHTGRRCGARR
ncbi:porin PorA family protein [Rhodococcus sp. NPDC057014]|uniref:porin PorA family protein n=1 Tax=Rhodococcus sp. NPDC057014 TaxID=3346000 RepID=UPI00364599A6